MHPSAHPSFSDLLKRYRLATRLTQEELATRAAMSVRAIAYLERGAHSPYLDTVRRLSVALGLAPADAAALAAAAHSAAPHAAGATLPSPPAQDAPPRHRTNLPAPLSSFVGRAREREEIYDLLIRASVEGDCRLLTLTGAGGCGKTRLALELGHDLLEDYPDGVWLVSLAALPASAQRDTRLVAGALADALALHEQPGQPVVATIREFLQPRRLMLVLDNCEHLLMACAALAATLLPACPSLTILATSRQRLGITGETVWQIPPLSSPPSAAGISLDIPYDERALAELRRYEAVQLFEQRARAQRRTFALSAANAGIVSLICSYQDGLPLALELAAGRVGILGLDALASRLGERLLQLTSSDPNAPPRQHTLHATVDWSYALLSGAEQAVLARLSVFAGGHSLEAAEWLVPAGAIPGVGSEDLPDLLGGLVEKNLIYFDEYRGAARYHMLEMVRHYMRSQLEAAGMLMETQRLHLSWCLDLAERAGSALSGPRHAHWLAQLALEHDNLRAALHRSLRERGDAAAGVRLATALWPFWDHRGYWTEGRAWLEEALAACPDAPTSQRAGALIGAGTLAFRQVEYDLATSLLHQAVALCRGGGDTQGLAAALAALGSMAEARSELGRAESLFAESLQLYRELGDQRGIAQITFDQAIIAQCYSEYARAGDLYRGCLALYRALGDQTGIARTLTSLGSIARAHSDYEQARQHHQEALDMFEALGDRRGFARALGSLSSIAEIQGQYSHMADLLERSLAVQRELGDHRGIADALAGLGTAAYHLGDDMRARSLLEESLALRIARADLPGIPHALIRLGDIACARGETEEAGRQYSESLAQMRRDHHRWGIAAALARLGRVAYLQGERALSGERYRESLALQRELRHRTGMVECLEGLALLDAAAGHQEWAVFRLAAAASARLALGARLSPREELPSRQTLAALRADLGEQTFRLAWDAGAAMTLDEALDTVDAAPARMHMGGEYRMR